MEEKEWRREEKKEKDVEYGEKKCEAVKGRLNKRGREEERKK